MDDKKFEPEKTYKDFNEIGQAEGDEVLENYIDGALNEVTANLPALEAAATEAQAKAAAEAEEETVKEKKSFEKKVAEAFFKLPAGDIHNATRIFFAFGNEIRYNTSNNFWGFFKKGVWRFETDKSSALYPYTRQLAAIASDNIPKTIAPPTKEDGSLDSSHPEYKKIQKHNQYCKWASEIVKRWSSRKLQSNAIEMLKGVNEILIKQEDLDQYPMLLNVENGTLDLETGEFYPHDPRQLLTKQCNVVYNPAARAPVFENFMQQILPDEDTRAAVLRYLGYCLTGRINEEKALFVWGSGANGKGTLFQTILKLFGSYGTSFNINALIKSKYPRDGEAATPEFAKLEGVRLAVAEEIPRGANFDVAKFKNLTGGDPIPIRQMYQIARIIEKPTHKFIFSGNDLPRAESATDDGFNRRLVVTKFLQQFTGDNADLTLKAKLETPDELSGIFNILLAECLEWQKPKAAGGGLIKSAAMEHEKQSYIADNDWFSDFISEQCELGADYDVARKALIKELKSFDSRAYKYTDRQLEEMFLKLDGVTLEQGERHSKYPSAKFFKGIQLTNNDIEPPPFY
ncbi:MAG: hypothetical protein IJS81_09820 [Selenomonadaceae bacterium]|nr:hypothetical protein [Selenomonadaceae bacterium]